MRQVGTGFHLQYRERVEIRPKRWRRYGFILAAVAVVIAAFSSITLSGETASGGALGATADKVALFGSGLIIAGVLFAIAWRPRAWADDAGMRVRNVLGEHQIAWSDVRAVRLPRGGLWANVELNTDDIVALSAVQSIDAEQAVVAITKLRELHKAATAA